jgi:hypothetical protein
MQLFDELDTEEQNKLPSDMKMNSPIVDALAWCAPLYTTKPQRVAILLWAFGYSGTGVSFLSLALKLHSPFPIPIGVGLLLVGTRITLNAFPRRTPCKTSRKP